MEKGNEDKTKQIENRLSKIVGQLKAIKRMTEEKRGLVTVKAYL
jgi:DNA-binding FrmR family transcriptional regulator